MRLKYLVFSMAALLFESGCKQLFREPTLDFSYKVPEQIGDGWTVSTLAAEGLRQAPIDSMTRLIVTDKFKNMHSVVIIKNHKLVYENYFNGYDRGMVHNLYSASKSFTSALIGVAIDKGFIPDTNVRVLSYFPEYKSLADNDVRKHDITLRNLLMMSSGLSCNDWDAHSPAAEETLYKKKDVLKALFEVPMAYPPDSVAQYCSGGVIALSHMISKTTGMNYTDFAKQTLLAPMGITKYKFTYREKNRTDRPDQIYLSPRDMCKFGQLYLNQGQWYGQQLISKAWVEASLAPKTTLGGAGYGFLWWLFSGTINDKMTYVYTAKGNGGQYIFIMPDLNMVVAMTGGNINSVYTNQGHEILYKFIIPANF